MFYIYYNYFFWGIRDSFLGCVQLYQALQEQGLIPETIRLVFRGFHPRSKANLHHISGLLSALVLTLISFLKEIYSPMFTISCYPSFILIMFWCIPHSSIDLKSFLFFFFHLSKYFI